MIILIHSSKTMRRSGDTDAKTSTPQFLKEAQELQSELRACSVDDLVELMEISGPLAGKVHEQIKQWTSDPSTQTPSASSFLGDIYSGLQVKQWSREDWQFASSHLKILSGLYGALRPGDGIYPYRLEMGYKLHSKNFKNLYEFWGDKVSLSIPKEELILSLTAKEYEKVLTPYTEKSRFIRPQFLTKHKALREYKQVIVHTKIARGAFAHWCIKNRIEKSEQLKAFAELGYRYDKGRSTDGTPVFICDEFEGIGLSVRLA